jgi:AraC-like DNA-binding protein
MMIGAVANVASGAPEFSYLSAPRQSSCEKIRAAAKNFIESNLSNPALDSAMVARHCGVSIRYLQRAFADDAQSLGAYIRETRLQRCHMALKNPALRNRPIFDIAMMWGFHDPSYFNRAYKKQFGAVPGKARPGN